MPSAQMPTFFISHGGGPWPDVEGLREQFSITEAELKKLPLTLPARPEAILVITGHWEAPQFTVSTAENPAMEYDYTGFPEHTYHIQYPAAGNPILANRVRELLSLAGIKSEEDAMRGFDHGTFVPLMLMYPNADIPVVLLSMKSSKYCRATHSNAGTVLDINLGKKYEQPLAETYDTKFNYENMTTAANYFSVEMKAAEGPLGTKDYRIWVEATPINNKQTFLHFTYAYSFGLTGRLAMNAYLATLGKDKVGFSVESTRANGEPNYIQGVRGVVERNTMRYYLAIDAYLAALKDAPETQQEKRLQYWFDSTERYATQLHEVERTEYLSMKREETRRQSITR